jgi:glycosyltransferase involved in cell wall biosynthesis
MLAEALSNSKFQPTSALFLWGTDLDYFLSKSNVDFHQEKIFSALESADLILADTYRDLFFLSENRQYPILNKRIVATCGFSEKELSHSPNHESRNEIIIKARGGDGVGIPELILDSIDKFPEFYRGFKLNFIMTSEFLIRRIQETCIRNAISFAIHPKLKYSDLLNLFRKSQFAIGASRYDGSPGFLIEAISMGCIPIYSKMESTIEWIKQGENGLLFENEVEDLIINLRWAREMDIDLVQTANKEVTIRELTRQANLRFIVEALHGAISEEEA